MPVRNKDDFLIFGSPQLEEEDIAAVESVMRSGWLGTGPKVAQFEMDFARYRDAKNAVALNSCTAALHLSLLAAGVGPGDEVITTPLTFCATVNAIIHAGATPVLADIDPVTMNIDPVQVRAKLSPKTRAIVPVHFAGRSCDMDAIMAIAHSHELKVIEDCAHAIETQYKGRSVGTIGDFGCFSFYVTKNIVTGEGGMVLTRREEDASRIKVLGLHGMSKDAWKRFGDDGYKHYQVVAAGFKYNMMDLQAALGLRQLQSVEKYWQRRSEIWGRYMDELSDLPLGLPAQVEQGTRHAYHLFSVMIDPAIAGLSRDNFLDAMTAHNIGVGVHYLALNEHPYYQENFSWKPEDTPHAQRVGQQTVSLPISAKLTDADVGDVIRAIRQILTKETVSAATMALSA